MIRRPDLEREIPVPAASAPVLLSVDIDGTLEIGDPPGPLPLALLRRAKQLGYIVGSASDRTLGEQRQLWETQGFVVDFVSHKHHLASVRSRFACARFIHVGDGLADEHYATKAGFEFWFVTELPPEGTAGWIL